MSIYGTGMHDPTLPVGSVARLAGVTVRTLHHYDAIGLLRPSGRAENGYRRYTATDVERLQRILFYRELGFGLDRIKDAMADPAADPLTHLREQHALLLERIERLQRLAGAVTRAMEAHTMGIDLSPEDRLEVFGSFDPEAHAEEARERWGSTDAYRESARRTRGYTKADWQRIGAEGGAVEARFAAAMAAGLPPDSAEAMAAAEAHRVHIDRSFYPCSHEMQAGLAELYVSDDRFRAHYDAVAPGLAAYVHDAIVANAATRR